MVVVSFFIYRSGVALDSHSALNWFPDGVVSARKDPRSLNPSELMPGLHSFHVLTRSDTWGRTFLAAAIYVRAGKDKFV